MKHLKPLCKSGFSLIEAIVVCFLLGIAFTGVFMLFTMGTRGFQSGISKAGTLGEMQLSLRLMKKELRSTNFLSASVHNRTATSTRGDVSRDGLCVAALSDWTNSARFEAGTSLPKWDRWSLFYSDRQDLGTFFKVELDRPPPGGGGDYYPLTPLQPLDTLMIGEPSRLDDVVRVVKLSSHVHSFEAEIDTSRRVITTKLTLFNDAGLKMTTQDRVEQFIENSLDIRPLNTFPEL